VAAFRSRNLIPLCYIPFYTAIYNRDSRDNTSSEHGEYSNDGIVGCRPRTRAMIDTSSVTTAVS
jgi:hypothetical protein